MTTTAPNAAPRTASTLRAVPRLQAAQQIIAAKRDDERIDIYHYVNGYFYNHYGSIPELTIADSIAGPFDSLEEAGLLKTETENEVKYLLYDELEIFERFANWHYDLDVNLPGVEVIHHLLQKMERLREENRKLINQLSNENI